MDESESLYRFKRKLVNCVVEEQSASECRESLIPIINTIAEENYDKEKEMATSLKKSLLKYLNPTEDLTPPFLISTRLNY